jgi:hypothetical protein
MTVGQPGQTAPTPLVWPMAPARSDRPHRTDNQKKLFSVFSQTLTFDNCSSHDFTISPWWTHWQNLQNAIWCFWKTKKGVKKHKQLKNHKSEKENSPPFEKKELSPKIASWIWLLDDFYLYVILLCADVNQVGANLYSNIEFLCCSCVGTRWGHRSIAGDGSGLGLGELRSRQSRISWGMLRLENNAYARGREGSHMLYTWCCVHMERGVKFGLEFVKFLSCTGRFPRGLGHLVWVGFLARNNHVMGINRWGIEGRGKLHISTFWEWKVRVCFEVSILVSVLMQ